MMRYQQIVRDFLNTIGAQTQAPLEALSTDTILAFKERWLSGGRSPRTVNQTIKILKCPFKIALEEGLIDRNPVAAVRPIRTSSAKKDVFSPEQIEHLLKAAESDWKGLILSGYFTGGRLVDLARLTSLWSRDRSGKPQGVYSHLTALALKELSDANPARLDLTFPRNFRRGSDIPKILGLHEAQLAPSEIIRERGYAVTTPIRAISDLADAGGVERDIISEALREGQKRGLITGRRSPKLAPPPKSRMATKAAGGSPLKGSEYATAPAFRRALQDRLAATAKSQGVGACAGMAPASIKGSASPLMQANQCRTVDQVVMLPDGADAKGWYVSLSRARDSMHVYTRDKAALRQSVMYPGERKSVWELVQLCEVQSRKPEIE